MKQDNFISKFVKEKNMLNYILWKNSKGNSNNFFQ
jgi:hypothetical protein